MRRMKYDILLSKINNYIYDSHMPINLSYWYNFGSILGIILIIQIITGLLLSMNYIATMELAYESVQYIRREVRYGNIIQSLHSNGAFFMFIAVYLHIARALKYGSYTYYRIGTWYVGIVLLLLMIITAFLGYSLPLGNMSLWAIAVITNLLSIIPYIGKDIVTYIYGGYNINSSTIGRFYTIHYLLPIIIALLSIIHLVLLHNKGGSNPLGISSIKNMGYINFHPYYTYKDIFGFLSIFIFYFFIVYFYPDIFGHSDNYIEANPLITPTHIVPEAYLLPFYSILRAIPNKTIGVLALLFAILVLTLLPYLFLGISTTDTFRPIYRLSLYSFFILFILLIYSGGCIVAEPYISISQILTIAYFYFFIIEIPLISFNETHSYNYHRGLNM
jgi:ubiquinol-cytochrome c reductase cytochrome b subunit